MNLLRPSVITVLLLTGMSISGIPSMGAAEYQNSKVRIPAGEFRMGTLKGTSWEKPAHSVWIDEFLIDSYEITNKEYESFHPKHPRSPRSACDLCPVTRVTWHEAESYCRHRGGRLATEAEWEKAARGPGEFPYGFGRQADPSRARYARDFHAGAVSVHQFEPNGYGVSQMSGNVWEWVRDWFGPYPGDRVDNPAGPETGVQKIVRGGSWHNPEYYVHAAMRFKLDPNVSLNSVGFRCAYDPP